MGEEVRGVPEAASLADGGIGHYLARQRRLRGISLDELSGLTKIPRRSLERLEAGSFDSAQDGFVRGFVRAVAVSLGLDPDEAVMRLMQEPREAAERAHRSLDAGGWLAGAGALVLGGLLAAGLWLLVASWLAPASPEAPSGVILRRDPVRALASDPTSGARPAARETDAESAAP